MYVRSVASIIIFYFSWFSIECQK